MSEFPPQASGERERIARDICRRIAAAKPGIGPIDSDTDLTRDVALDSAAIMALVFDLEEEYGISIPLNQLGDARTVGDLGAIVAELKEEAS